MEFGEIGLQMPALVNILFGSWEVCRSVSQVEKLNWARVCSAINNIHTLVQSSLFTTKSVDSMPFFLYCTV